jgi:hypothetical protein
LNFPRRSARKKVSPSVKAKTVRGINTLRTFCNTIHIVVPITVTPNIFGKLDTRFKFGFQDVALVQEEYDFNIGQKLVLAKGFPKQYRILLKRNHSSQIRRNGDLAMRSGLRGD